MFSVILPSNERSMAVARRLGFNFVGERVLTHFPGASLGIWRLGHDEWTEQSAGGADLVQRSRTDGSSG